MSIADRTNVRFATAADLPWLVSQDDKVSEEVLQRKVALGEIIVAELEGALIGCLRLEYLWSTIPLIALIWVEEPFRRQGVGRAILTFLERFVRSKGHNLLLSSSTVTEPEPQAWHRAAGFRECGLLAGINGDGIGEIFFSRELADGR